VIDIHLDSHDFVLTPDASAPAVCHGHLSIRPSQNQNTQSLHQHVMPPFVSFHSHSGGPLGTFLPFTPGNSILVIVTAVPTPRHSFNAHPLWRTTWYSFLPLTPGICMLSSPASAGPCWFLLSIHVAPCRSRLPRTIDSFVGSLFTWSLLLVATTTDFRFVRSLFAWPVVPLIGLPRTLDRSFHSSSWKHGTFRTLFLVRCSMRLWHSCALRGSCSSSVDSLFAWSYADHTIDYHGLLIQPPLSCGIHGPTPVVSTPPDSNSLVLLGSFCSVPPTGPCSDRRSCLVDPLSTLALAVPLLQAQLPGPSVVSKVLLNLLVCSGMPLCKTVVIVCLLTSVSCSTIPTGLPWPHCRSL
jgi:hypothetical protein